LLLLDGVIYIAWGSHGDMGPFHGWIMGYSAHGLKQVSVLNTTPNGKGGSIWMSGGALAADTNHNIFAVTGNGTFDANRRGNDYGDTVLKVSTQRGLSVVDYFTPFNQAALSAVDHDLGSGGVLLLPDQPGLHRHMLVVAGKEGKVYLIDCNNMGHFNRAADRVVTSLPGALLSAFSTPAYFRDTVFYVGTPYVGAKGIEFLKAFHLTNGRLSTPPALGAFSYGYPGSTPSISSNGTANGIVWTLDNSGAGAARAAILRAYDANHINKELYDSTQAGTRDEAGPGVKFAVPTVINGAVFVGGNGVLTVYGTLKHA
jgi:hypothetical protein